MLTALLLVASLAVRPTPTLTGSVPAASRPEAVAALGAAQDPGFAGWLAHEEGLPAGATASGPVLQPAVTCTSSCTTCAAMHRSCCFDNFDQCFYCVPPGVKCL
ncbi:MAG TPA: hypothetical protein VFE33_24690 [Thermoanaerobaculia bacterium]|nr:hypothetical protein [Thermoanaerobaculia bacterium]